MSTSKSRLGDLLVEMKLVDQDVMQTAQAEARRSGRRLARVLEERHLIDEERLTRVIASHLNIEAVSLAGVRIHDRVLGLVPTSIAVAKGVLPIAVKRTNQADVVYLVMADPLDTAAIGEVQRVTGRQVRVLIAKASEVDDALAQHYGSRPRTPTSSPIPAENGGGRSESRPRRASAPPTPRPAPPLRPPAATGRVTPAPRPPPWPTPPGGQSIRSGSTRPAEGEARSMASRMMLNADGRLSPAASAVTEPPPLAPPTTSPVRYPERADFAESLIDRSIGPNEFDAADGSATQIDDPFTGLQERRNKANEDPAAVAEEWERSVREWDGAGLSSPDRRTDGRSGGTKANMAESGAHARNEGASEAFGAEALAGDALRQALETSANQQERSGSDRDPVTALAQRDGIDWAREVEPKHGQTVQSSPRRDAQVAPDRRDTVTKDMMATALEIPVNWEDESHPFKGPGQSDIPVGLDKTAIIPAADISGAQFEPPPLDEPRRVTSALVGSDDIPTSMEIVEARAKRDEEEEEEAEIEEVALEPIGDDDVLSLESERATARPPPGTDSGGVPVLEPSQLLSLIDEVDASQHDTGADVVPRIGSGSITDDLTDDELAFGSKPPPASALEDGGAFVSPFDLTGDDATKAPLTPSAPSASGVVMSALDNAFGGSGPPTSKPASSQPPGAEATRHATSLVAALRKGASLSSPQRAELILAIGRLMLDKGLITEAELLKALLQ